MCYKMNLECQKSDFSTSFGFINFRFIRLFYFTFASVAFKASKKIKLAFILFDCLLYEKV